MPENNIEDKLLAHALYQIRILLSDYLGSHNEGPIEVRTAAHLAYALHNEALAVIEGKNFDVKSALAKVEAIDKLLNVEDGMRLSRSVFEGKT